MGNASRTSAEASEHRDLARTAPPTAIENCLAVWLLALSLPLYVVTTGFDFVSDDNLLLLHDPYVPSFRYLRRIFTGGFWGFRSTAESHTGFYRPLVMLTLLFEGAALGYRPAGFHLVNVALNALVVVSSVDLRSDTRPINPMAAYRLVGPGAPPPCSSWRPCRGNCSCTSWLASVLRAFPARGDRSAT